VSSSLVTGEAVALDVQTAGVASRMLAALVDGLIQGALLFGLFVAIGLFGGGGSTASVAALGVLAFVTAGLVYPVMFETLMRGRTPGKAALGLRVVRDDAGPISFRQAFVRGLIGFVVERPGVTFASAAVISSILSPTGKRLGDLAAGTVVLQERVVAPKAPVAQMPPGLAGWAATLDLSQLSDELALSVRTFLARSASLTPAARVDLGNRLTGAVRAAVRSEPPAGTPPEAFLAAVLAERRLRAERGAPPAEPWPAGPPAAEVPTYPEVPPPSGGFALPS
jgi:uncharacterized RDD family membrane protein YckC